MARIYGYWDDELNTFVPTGGASQQQGAMPIGGNQGSYGVPYNKAPRYNQRFYAPGGTPTNVAVGFNNGPRVRYNYQPRYTGNGYAPRGYNTNMNYGPWYGQQSYATYPPYAPYQPRYEWMPGFNGQATAVRLGEYQREQPVAYEMMYNSQGIPVRVPVYAPMNNSAMPVRVGVSPDGQSYGNVNYQAAFPQQRQQQRTATRVRNMPSPVPFVPFGQVSSPPSVIPAGPYDVSYYALGTNEPVNNASSVPDLAVSSVSLDGISSIPEGIDADLVAKYENEIIKREGNRATTGYSSGYETYTPLTREEIRLEAIKSAQDEMEKKRRLEERRMDAVASE